MNLIVAQQAEKYLVRAKMSRAWSRKYVLSMVWKDVAVSFSPRPLYFREEAHVPNG
jgi:hypothetical protein